MSPSDRCGWKFPGRESGGLSTLPVIGILMAPATRRLITASNPSSAILTQHASGLRNPGTSLKKSPPNRLVAESEFGSSHDTPCRRQPSDSPFLSAMNTNW